MSYVVRYTEEADATIAKYKSPTLLHTKKVLRLLKEITDHPREGTGHPEPLSGGSDITYSRRISG